MVGEGVVLTEAVMRATVLEVVGRFVPADSVPHLTEDTSLMSDLHLFGSLSEVAVDLIEELKKFPEVQSDFDISRADLAGTPWQIARLLCRKLHIAVAPVVEEK